jgi:protoheme IX farnesyltransferase
VSLESIMLFALIFFWTPPHFWALALYKNADYKKAGIPMLPVVSGEAVTKRQIIFYSLILTPFALAPYFMHLAGTVYLVLASVLQGIFILGAFRVWKDETYKSARMLFVYSIFYLFALFAAMMLDKVY